MNEKWQPRPKPKSRAGALAFILVLLLFLLVAGALFLLNPAAQPDGPLRVREAPRPEALGLHLRLWLPALYR